MKKLIPFLLLFVFALAFPVCAGEDTATSWPESSWVKTEPYVEKIGHKLGFGVLNLTTGWTQLFFEPVRHGLIKGLYRGIIHTVAATGGGALHAVTFLIPFDIPLPEGGVHFEQ